MPSEQSGWSRLRVLRLCSVFEPPPSALSGRGVRFDPIGGMQNHTAQLTRALAALGVEQEVITHRPPGAPRTEGLCSGAIVRRFGLPLPWCRQLYSAPAALAALRGARRFDLIHAHQGEDLAVLPIVLGAARLASRPLVVTLHTSLRHTFSGGGHRGRLLSVAGGRIEAAVCRRADGIIALSCRLAAALQEDGVRAERISVVPPGVNSPEFASAGEDPFPELPHPRLVFVGRLVHQKGVDTLLAAAARMRREDARILLVGDGPLRPQLEASIRESGLEGRVRILGFRSHAEIPAILANSDLFCLPSRFEEVSSALLEAMRAGLPIVATSVGGIPEVLDGAGRLVTAEDPVSLAQAIDELLSDTPLAARLGAEARKRAGRYEWREIARNVLDVYRAALERWATQGKASREPVSAFEQSRSA
jgi:glycosyltransferase involved in cell wall biosynthesis